MSPAATTVGQADPTVPLAAGGGRLATGSGHTTISPRACERIAARAAAEVEGVGVVESGLARLVPWSGAPPGGAAAEVEGHTVSLDLSIRVPYPRPVVETARRVRHQVSRRLGELAGLAVRDVTITVAELPAVDATPPRRVE